MSAPDFAGMSAFRHREAGYAVAAECLRVQAAAERVDPTLRTRQGVRLADDARSWFVGALGEIAVGRLLDGLGDGWFIRHSVPIGTGTTDVDHLVIGPPGVFAINTKRRPGAQIWVGDRLLKVNNHPTWYLRDSLAESGKVSDRLTRATGFRVAAHPVLAFVDTVRIRDSRQPIMRNVSIAPAADLARWLSAQPARLRPSELQLICLAAEEVGTWHIDPRAADSVRDMQRFERLRAEVIGTPNVIPVLGRPASVRRPVRPAQPPLRPVTGPPSGMTSGARPERRARAARGAIAWRRPIAGGRVAGTLLASAAAALVGGVLWGSVVYASGQTAPGAPDHVFFQMGADHPWMIAGALLGVATVIVGAGETRRSRSRSRR